MSRTRFSELAGDALAAGGAARGIDTKAIGSRYSYGRVIDFHNTGDAASFANAPAAPTAAWGVTPINAGVGVFAPGSGSNPGMRFTFHNAGATGLGADLIWADVGNSTVGVIPPPLRQSTAAAGSYEPECFVEMMVRRGTVATGLWTTGGLHFMAWGICPQAPGTTILDTAGAFVQTTNIATFYMQPVSSLLTMQAAGASGGFQAVAPDFAFTDTTFNGKHLAFGIRLIGTNKVEMYLNRKLMGKITLTNAMATGSYTFFATGVTGSAGGDRVIDLAYVAYGGTRRTAEFLSDREATDQV